MSWFRHCPYQPPPCVWSKRWFAGHCVSSPYAINYELAVAQTRGGYQLVTPTITTRPLMPALAGFDTGYEFDPGNTAMLASRCFIHPRVFAPPGLLPACPSTPQGGQGEAGAGRTQYIYGQQPARAPSTLTSRSLMPFRNRPKAAAPACYFRATSTRRSPSEEPTGRASSCPRSKSPPCGFRGRHSRGSTQSASPSSACPNPGVPGCG